MDGSLGECEGTRHNMNRLCIVRTKQLDRTEIEIVVNRETISDSSPNTLEMEVSGDKEKDWYEFHEGE